MFVQVVELRASPQYVAQWLVEHTRFACLEPWPQGGEGGKFVLHAQGFREGSPGRLRMLGFLGRADGDAERAAEPAPFVLAEARLEQVADEVTILTLVCRYPPLRPYLEHLVAEMPQVWDASPRTPGRGKRALGPHGGTLDRVREARTLMERGEPKTRACRRAGIDPRTFDRYAADVVDWEELD